MAKAINRQQNLSENEHKQYDVFISFAEPDREIADTLNKILKEVGLTSYFAPKDIPIHTPSKFQEGIIKKGIQQSHCFIMICTQESINRSWVLFEAGAATALGLKCYCTRVERITDKEIGTIPNPNDLHHYKLFDKTDLQNLFRLIANDARGTAAQEIVDKINDIFAAPNHIRLNHLIALASVRWVFIAGNKPSGKQKLTPKRQRVMHTFVKKISEMLLKSGFSITACPQVKGVGRVALLSAEKFLTSQKERQSSSLAYVDYAIGGIYPIDHDIRNLAINTNTKSRWQDHLMGFRKSYLGNQEWLILLGGNIGTREEYEAVQSLNRERRSQIKTYPIPCFGGVAEKVFKEIGVNGGADYLQPCVTCKNKKNPCNRIEEIVKSMEET